MATVKPDAKQKTGRKTMGLSAPDQGRTEAGWWVIVFYLSGVCLEMIAYSSPRCLMVKQSAPRQVAVGHANIYTPRHRAREQAKWQAGMLVYVFLLVGVSEQSNDGINTKMPVQAVMNMHITRYCNMPSPALCRSGYK